MVPLFLLAHAHAPLLLVLQQQQQQLLLLLLLLLLLWNIMRSFSMVAAPANVSRRACGAFFVLYECAQVTKMPLASIGSLIERILSDRSGQPSASASTRTLSTKSRAHMTAQSAAAADINQHGNALSVMVRRLCCCCCVPLLRATGACLTLYPSVYLLHLVASSPAPEPVGLSSCASQASGRITKCL